MATSGAGRGRSRYQYLQSLNETQPGPTPTPTRPPTDLDDSTPAHPGFSETFSGPGSPGPVPFMGAREHLSAPMPAAPAAPPSAADPDPAPVGGQSGKLDTRKLPNPTKGYETSEMEKLTEPVLIKYDVQTGAPLPRVTSEFIVTDTWNCSPRFIRSTMYNIPTSSAIQKQGKIPLGLVLSPLAEVVPGEYPINVVDHGTEGPIRCTRCRAYINPFIVWNQSGSQYTCMFCGQQNDTPNHYYSPLVNGQRQDIASRPELYRGSVDFVATDMYKTTGRPPTPASYVFVVDTSLGALQSGVLHSFVAAMQQILPTLLEQSPVKIAFITFDSVVSFYNISNTRPSMAVMPDIAKPYLPIPFQLCLQSYGTAKKCVDSLLESFLNVFSTSNTSSACLGSAVQAATRLLVAAKAIGKIMVFASTIPELGLGKLQRRLVAAESTQEKTMYTPQNTFYTEIGTTCAKNGIAVDVFGCSSVYIDVCSLSEMVRTSGGQVYYYPSFSAQTHGGQLFRELFRNLSREAGYDGLLRVRSSTGLSQSGESGHFIKQNDTDLNFGHLSADSSLHIEFSYDETLPDNQYAYFQCAFLYTSPTGDRRIRVHNLKIQTASNLTKVFKAADLDATLNVLVRKSLPDIAKDPMATVRNNFLEGVTDILASYRVNCAKTPQSGQLILPESLRLLPIYSLGLMKSALFGPLKHGTNYTILPDARSYFIATHNTLSIRDQCTWIYPTIYAISDLIYNPKFGSLHEDGNPFFPGMCRPLLESFASEGIYLVDSLDSLFLWIGSAVPQEIVNDLLAPEANTPEAFQMLVPLTPRETDLSQRLFNLLSSKPLQRALSPEIFVIRQGSVLETFVACKLMEDGAAVSDVREMSYSEFLKHVHAIIQKKNKEKR